MSHAAHPVRVLLAPAVGSVGGGHLVRSAALAMALAERGAEVAFATASGGERLLARVAPELRARHFATPVPAALAETALRFAPDLLVLDDYAMAAAEERPLRDACSVLAVIDDLADRAHDADLLLDPSYRRRAGDYAGLVPRGAEVLAGPLFALLRPEFARLRPAAPRVRDGPPKRVFVSFGLADPDGVAETAVRLLRPLAPAARFDVALGAKAASLAPLRALAADDAGITLHVESPAVAALMAEADVAVGAGGSSVWERACLGLPSLAVAVAENQRPMLRALSAHGVVIGVDMAEPEWCAKLETGFKVLADPTVSQGLSIAALALCDGLGAGRAAEALLARLRAA